MSSFRFLLGGLAAALIAPSIAAAEVAVEAPWVRGTVAAQRATGAFMRLTAPTAVRLVAASTPLAGTTEVHEMAMDNDVMKMRPVAALDLPAGVAVELKPGGYHIMLMGLSAPLGAGAQVPITLTFEHPDGRRVQQTVEAPVHALGAAAPAMSHGAHMRH
ncbi:MAG: copper chaperone PCu(A)C [Rhodocyclaceae bacterium]|nr:copper chaperone PCu(A)C [Rhodocyclaceae bacterium]MCB1962409.1 copper chaperone PCu(A)C [Rhodocyclaceae bacterium]